MSIVHVDGKGVAATPIICRRPISERGMRPRGVVVVGPGADEPTGLVEIDKQAFVEKLVAHPTVEGFDEAVLHGLPGVM
jgi:hypothetical protein